MCLERCECGGLAVAIVGGAAPRIDSLTVNASLPFLPEERRTKTQAERLADLDERIRAREDELLNPVPYVDANWDMHTYSLMRSGAFDDASLGTGTDEDHDDDYAPQDDEARDGFVDEDAEIEGTGRAG